ncbi:Sodium- and chloride-dependent glycine transporter 2 [Bulinus truncatus]|nr:Sodium- and chloride-dependent glycine transporter 2 [Bulinus truncatus]
MYCNYLSEYIQCLQSNSECRLNSSTLSLEVNEEKTRFNGTDCAISVLTAGAETEDCNKTLEDALTNFTRTIAELNETERCQEAKLIIANVKTTKCPVSLEFKDLMEQHNLTNCDCSVILEECVNQYEDKIRSNSNSSFYCTKVLAFSDGIQNFGLPKWDLVLCLLLAWVICFFCLIKGIKSTGKVVYFTALFPYLVLFILLFRGITLENASEGIYYFITPNFSRLADANVWKDAANQIFFSMGIAGGGLITLSSYNRFHNNIQRDSVLVAIGDSLTCLLGGFVIFSYLGYMAGQLDVSVQDVAADGAGLAFVVYPEAISSLPPSTLWALLFFVMLLTLGLDSQFAMLETIMTGLIDQFPKLRPKKVLVILVICIILFIMGLPLTAPGGIYMLQLMDNYVGGLTLIIIAFFELVSITYIYGVRRFCSDLHLMTGSTIFIYWKIVWCVVSPFTIGFIFIFMFIDYKGSTYGDYTYPGWADAMGWLMTMASVIAIPIVMIYKISREKEGETIWQKIRLLCLPSVYWGPALKQHRELVTYVDGFQVDPLENLQPQNKYKKNKKPANQESSQNANGSLKNHHLKSGIINNGFEDSPETPVKVAYKGNVWLAHLAAFTSPSRKSSTHFKLGGLERPNTNFYQDLEKFPWFSLALSIKKNIYIKFNDIKDRSFFNESY